MNKYNKILLKLALSTFLVTSTVMAAAPVEPFQEQEVMSEERYRALNIETLSQVAQRANGLCAVFEDSAENFEREGAGESGKARDAINDVVKILKGRNVRLRDIADSAGQLGLIAEVVGIRKGLRRDGWGEMVRSWLKESLKDLNNQRAVNLGVCDFEEYYRTYDPYQKITANIYKELLAFYADNIKSAHALVGERINATFDQFLASELLLSGLLPDDKYLSIYFRILKGYVTGKVDQVPYFGLSYLGDLDKNPARKECDDLESQIKGIRPKTAADRLKKSKLEKDLQEALPLVGKFEAEDRPILEKYYRQALETLQGIGDISAEELQVLAALRQKAGPEKAPLETPQAAKKKKPKKKKLKSILPDDEDEEVSEIQRIIPAPASSTISYPELTETEVAETEKAIAEQQEQYAKDRAKKTTPPPQRTSPVIPGDAAADANPEEEAGVIHAQKAKLIAEFWEEKKMSWSNYEKFMTSVMGGRMEASGGGGSHYKVKFMHEDSEVSFSTYHPHKFGSNYVGKGQLEGARSFLRETLKVALPQ